MQDARRQVKQQHLRSTPSAFVNMQAYIMSSAENVARRYLEQQALLEQLESLLDDAFTCIESTDSSKGAEKALRRQGFQCSQQVYQAAHDHLQVQ